MAQTLKGELVVIPFPFTDLSHVTKRPAYVCAVLKGNDVILCQVTSKQRHDEYSISLSNTDLMSGFFHIDSFIRPNRLFTLDASLIMRNIGIVTREKQHRIEQKLISIFRSQSPQGNGLIP